MSKIVSSSDSQRKRKPRWFRRVLLCIAVLLGATVGYGWYLWKGVPPEYVAYENYLRSLSSEKKSEIVQSVTARFQEIMGTPGRTWGRSATGPDGSNSGAVGSNFQEAVDAGAESYGLREFTLSIQDANVWLSEELPRFAERQGQTWPAQVSQPMISVSGKNVTVRFKFDSPELSQVVSVTTTPEFRPDGTASFKVNGVQGGNLPLPAEGLVGAARKNAPSTEAGEAIERVGELMKGEPFAVRFDFDEQRDISWVGWSSDGSNVTLRLMVEPRKTNLANAEIENTK